MDGGTNRMSVINMLVSDLCSKGFDVGIYEYNVNAPLNRWESRKKKKRKKINK